MNAHAEIDSDPPVIFPIVHSSLVERVLEHKLLGELTAELLLRGKLFDILRGDCDRFGHDLVIEVDGIMRHIQLKASGATSKTASVKVSTLLANKPSACVIWVIYDPATYTPIRYRWFGGLPGQPQPALGDRIGKHTKGNKDGLKACRPAMRVVRKGRFTEIASIAALADRLFEWPRDHALLIEHIAMVNLPVSEPWLGEVANGRFDAIPEGLNWYRSVELAHLIEGYRLAAALGLGDGFDYAERQLSAAMDTGVWPGGPVELWISLFLEHRRWKFSSPCEPEQKMLSLLDKLVAQLREALVAPSQPLKLETLRNA